MTIVNRPATGMILAAGLGKRMRPLSAITPKPLIPVAGQAMIDRALSALALAKVSRTVINVHYLADLVEVHVRKHAHMDIVISDEREELLETGGGITKALPMIGEAPFYVLNSDSFWMEGAVSNLDILANHWIPDDMDALLLLSPTVQAVGYQGRGDFLMDPFGRLRRRKAHEVSPFVYSGAAIMHPRLFDGASATCHSLNVQFDKAIAEDRLYGVIMDGTWMHVGTPSAIPLAERAIAESAPIGRLP
ncbi:nucleotidyltransferase family protein [Cohaesibacter celericrescens]|uniref:Mannose-1-phosphate guanylyltransferase n=1 Tax=Cohaesibacter celericrescens TaxID=2067669 RepID=A0A2N5XN94_9HYPH|nr:nucleotidyltransferase family protein [Cohaesibacter celericrescens]PLW75887.1 mannose-1-phosphate guanylyltransferase [Cohaesibacter celericrescens]